MIQKLIIEIVIKAIAKKFKLDKVLSYVEDDNELDLKVRKLERRLKKIEKSI